MERCPRGLHPQECDIADDEATVGQEDEDADANGKPFDLARPQKPSGATEVQAERHASDQQRHEDVELSKPQHKKRREGGATSWASTP